MSAMPVASWGITNLCLFNFVCFVEDPVGLLPIFWVILICFGYCPSSLPAIAHFVADPSHNMHGILTVDGKR